MLYPEASVRTYHSTMKAILALLAVAFTLTACTHGGDSNRDRLHQGAQDMRNSCTAQFTDTTNQLDMLGLQMCMGIADNIDTCLDTHPDINDCYPIDTIPTIG